MAPGYIIVWHPPASCGRRICTQFHPSIGQGYMLMFSTGCTSSLIDGCVEGQYVTCSSNERKWLFTKKRQEPDNIVLPENTPTQTEFRMHSLEQTAGGIGLNMNADKTEYICLNQKREITLNGGSLNLVNKSHLLKMTSMCNSWKHGQLMISYRSYGRQTYPIK